MKRDFTLESMLRISEKKLKSKINKAMDSHNLHEYEFYNACLIYHEQVKEMYERFTGVKKSSGFNEEGMYYEN